MTKLALLVVYVFDEKTRKLFDIHLERIRRHTDCEYRIFAAAHKLSSELRQVVAKQPDIELVDCNPRTDSGVRIEHSDCLEKLAAFALERDFSHCMTIHLDSFPIADHWLDNLLESLRQGAVLASVVPNGYSAGLLWPRTFSEQWNPRMLVPEKVRESERFAEFVKDFPDIDHVETGLGYIYCAWEAGLPWRQIRTDHERKIYDNIFYHLVGATFRTWTDAQKIRKDRGTQLLWGLIKPGLRLLPLQTQRRVRELFIDKEKMTRDGSVRSKREEIEALIADPDTYIDNLIKSFSPPELQPSPLTRSTARQPLHDTIHP